MISIADVGKLDEAQEVSEETYYYYLEVLPPVYMNRTIEVGGVQRRVSFGFAEGAERVTAFWVERDEDGTEHYWSQRTKQMNPYAFG